MDIKQVKVLLKKHNKKMKDFNMFMRGQTVGLNPDDSVDFYDDDVMRFMWS